MVLRFYSCLFALALGLFMTGVSGVLLLSGSQNYKFDMLPFWKGESALYGLLALGILGIAAAALALLGKLKPLIVLYTLAAFALLVYGYFVSPVYRFGGEAEAKSTLWLVLAALAAFLASLMHLKSPKRA
ncbi:MAG: hypothetical protein IPP47_33545 [Bryobacterales bacterium]|nr:hypothetical protein [Bryobacterales bacterium]